VTNVEIDRTPIVWVDKRQVPEFGALIDVGNAGHRHFQDKLRDTVQRTEQSATLSEGGERLDERR
jgi:hypothetical protein